MAKYELVIADQARDSFEQAVAQAREASLIGAEKLREAVLSGLHKVATDPKVLSHVVEGASLPGELRRFRVMQYQIHFLIQASRIVVLDLLWDPEKINPSEEA